MAEAGGSASHRGGRGSRRGRGRNQRGGGRGGSKESSVKPTETSSPKTHASADVDPARGSSRGKNRGRRAHEHQRGGPKEAFRSTTRTRPSHVVSFSFDDKQQLDESPGQLKDFLTVTLSSLSSSEQPRKDAIRYIVTDDGLARVRRIVETKFSVRYSVTKPMFDPHCLLFLRVITDKYLLRSVALESDVGTIYSVIYGPHGSRAISFFQNVMDCLQETQVETQLDSRTSSQNNDTPDRLEQLVLVTKALLHIVTVNQGAAIKVEFKDIAEKLNALYTSNKTTTSDKTNKGLHEGYESLHKLASILAMGDKITSFQPCKDASSSKHSDEHKYVELPGELSKSGPRHDNDHVLIEDIRILPTLSEVNSLRNDFLPTRNASKYSNTHHQEGILRLLDSQFRLLREDTSGLLRDAIRVVIQHWETIVSDSNWSAKRKLIRNECPTPIRIYYGTQIQALKVDGIRGLEVDVEFDQVRRIKRMGPGQRKKHWLNSRALREGGGLVALVDAESDDNATVLFMQVSKRQINPIGEGTPKTVCDVVSSGERAMVTLRFPTTPTKVDTSGLIRMESAFARGSERSMILVEFPALLYNHFEGILRCLQSLHKTPHSIPFTRWLTVGESESPYNGLAVPPPLYLRGSTLDLDIADMEGAEGSSTQSTISISPSEDPDTLNRQINRLTSLDLSQAKAMVAALTHEISLIQGPPGTGKSYVGIQIAKCLLNNKIKSNLGPLLCVSYTNHALDQFLVELKNSGITRIVRIGSRSQSDAMESLSLDSYKKRGNIPQIRGMGKLIGTSKSRLERLAAGIDKICQDRTTGPSATVHTFLSSRAHRFAEEIYEGHSDPLPRLESWVAGDGPGDISGDGTERSIEELFSVQAWSLTNSERLRMWQYCYDCGTKDQLYALEVLLRAHASEKKLHTSLFNEGQAQFLNHVDIIGVTTTGLANNIDLLRTVQAKVLICEEAGEVLESHILTALLPSIEHAILIGDHLQLRPRISRLSLSMEYENGSSEYNLDESLFERLAGTKLTLPDGHPSERIAKPFEFPVAQLEEQRRMHPCISSLIRRDLYPNLKDHPRTDRYPEIAGIKRRLFWLDHENPEDPSDPEEPMQSKTNTWEAEMVTALVSHLCRQGKYKPGEIAVLTPYVGQLKLLKDKLENIVDLIISEPDREDLDDVEEEMGQTTSGGASKVVHKGSLLDQVRLATVDNFQGEEAVVVIISLVRSNRFRNCGFLKTPNRINVLLSRAKHGMYIIGSAQTSHRVPMWGSVISMLEDSANIGPQLELQCPRHPEAKISVATPDDFSKYAPEGGCSNKCGLRLDCGHTCTFKCHSARLHSSVKCMESCMRPRMCGHVCPKRCYEPCGDCTEVVPDVCLPCGHTAKVQCRDTSRLHYVKCLHVVTKTLSGCGHTVRVTCSQNPNTIKCTNLCGGLYPCGHDCQKECWSCRVSGTVNHGVCKMPCGKRSTTCAHACTQPCHGGTPCRPCRLPCEVRCVHNRCPRKCNEPCPPCAEVCGWSCSHSEESCKLPCAVPCNILPCKHQCDKLLSCGHRCPGLCGEQCPEAKLCRQCGSPQVLQRPVEFLEMKTYADADPSQDPLIFLSCGHFYTLSTMDQITELSKYYVIDPSTETLLRPKPAAQIDDSASPPGCPECRRPLRDIHRYNRIVKNALLHESTKRFVSKAQRDYIELFKAVQLYEEEIEKERSVFVNKWRSQDAGEGLGLAEIKAVGDTYENKDIKIQKRIKQFIKDVSKTEQPFGRVNALLASVMARTGDAESMNTSAFEESAIQTGFQLRGYCLDLRLGWAKLLDYDRIQQNTTVSSQIRVMLRGRISNHLPQFLVRCRTAIDDSIKGKSIAEQLQAMVYHTLFSRLSYTIAAMQGNATKPDSATHLSQDEIAKTLEKCEEFFLSYEGTLAPYRKLVEGAKRFCDGGTFYTPVTDEEKQQVYQAMAAQFMGTGHWYYCRNRHPFTVGECGMPMEQARCPQCGEPVGGQDHSPASGVQRAEDIESRFGGA